MNNLKLLITIIISSMFIYSGAFAQEGKRRYSGSGRNPPKVLSERQIGMVKEVLKVLPSTSEPVEIIALAMVESGLTRKAVSHTGDYGILQVNCRIHRKLLKRTLGVTNCEREMFNLKTNVLASTLILGLFRKKYKQCKGEKAYACYNGGQGWRYRYKQCLKACESSLDPGVSCRKCGRPARYSSSVKKHKKFLLRKYKHLFP